MLVKRILILFASCFLLGLAIGGELGHWHRLIASIYTFMSIITILVYKWDKRLAKSAKQVAARVSERSLHVLALLCGWPGALIAQQWFRHKSKKRPFIGVLWLTIILNQGLLIGWLLYFKPLINAL